MLAEGLKNIKVRQIKTILIILLLIFSTGGIILFWQIQKLASQIPLGEIKEQQLLLSRVGLLFIAVCILTMGIFLIFLARGAWRDGFYNGYKDGYEKGKIDGNHKA